jgi:hypothetical protein
VDDQTTPANYRVRHTTHHAADEHQGRQIPISPVYYPHMVQRMHCTEQLPKVCVRSTAAAAAAATTANWVIQLGAHYRVQQLWNGVATWPQRVEQAVCEVGSWRHEEAASVRSAEVVLQSSMHLQLGQHLPIDHNCAPIFALLLFFFLSTRAAMVLFQHYALASVAVAATSRSEGAADGGHNHTTHARLCIGPQRRGARAQGQREPAG